MQAFRRLPPLTSRRPCALTIGNFDGVHRGHQAMLALLTSEARHRRLASCVLSFEPHPRDHFARRAGRPELAPPRIATLRDKLAELQRCGIDQVVVAPVASAQNAPNQARSQFLRPRQKSDVAAIHSDCNLIFSALRMKLEGSDRPSRAHASPRRLLPPAFPSVLPPG